MQVDTVLSWLASGPLDPKLLGRTGRALGDELPRRRLDELARLRAGLARLAPDEPYAAGYLRALADVSVAYEALVRTQDKDARVADEVGRRPVWQAALAHLTNGSMLPSDLANALGKDRSQVTKALTSLRELGLVETFVDENNGRVRPHGLTFAGKLVLERLGEMGPAQREMVAATVEVVRRLVTLGRARSDELEAAGDGAALAPAVLNAILTACEGAGLLAQEGDVATWVEPDRKRHIAALNAWFNTTESERRQHALSKTLDELAQRDVPLVVFTEGPLRNHWWTCLGERFPRGSRVLTPRDFQVPSLERPDSYLLLSDASSAMRDLAEVERGALSRETLISGALAAPRGYNPRRIDTVTEALP